MEALTTLTTTYRQPPTVPPPRRHVLAPPLHHPLLCLPFALRVLGLTVGAGLVSVVRWVAGVCCVGVRWLVGCPRQGSLGGPVVVLGPAERRAGQSVKRSTLRQLQWRGAVGRAERAEGRSVARAHEPAPTCVAGRWGVIRSGGWKPIAQPRRMPEGQ